MQLRVETEKMLLSRLCALAAILYWAGVTDADVDYNCKITNNNANTAAMMCQYESPSGSNACGRICNTYAEFKDTGGTYCFTAAYECRGGCDNKSWFKLQNTGEAHDSPDLSTKCCKADTTENAIVCARCGWGSSAYYKNFTAKAVGSCLCSTCDDAALVPNTREKLRTLFSNTELTSTETTCPHG